MKLVNVYNANRKKYVVLLKVVDQWSETYEPRKHVSEDDFVVIGRIIQLIGKIWYVVTTSNT